MPRLTRRSSRDSFSPGSTSLVLTAKRISCEATTNMFGEQTNRPAVNAPLVAMVGAEYRHVLLCCEALIAAGAHYDASALLLTVIRCVLSNLAGGLGLGFGEPRSIDSLTTILRHELDPALYIALKRSPGERNIEQLLEVAREIVDRAYGPGGGRRGPAGEASTQRGDISKRPLP